MEWPAHLLLVGGRGVSVLSLSFQPKDLDTTIFFEIKKKVQFVIILFGVSKKVTIQKVKGN